MKKSMWITVFLVLWSSVGWWGTAAGHPLRAPALSQEYQEAGVSTDRELGDSEPCDWSGLWYTTWGNMYLTQSGAQVGGYYDQREGGRNGKLGGTVSGSGLSGWWSESDDPTDMWNNGYFSFTISDDCQRFSGTWRYGDGKLNYPWNGSRPSETADMSVYPSVYLNKSEIKLSTDNPDAFGADIYFTVENEGSKARIEDAESSGIYWTTIDDKGVAKATLVYKYTSMDDMLTYPKIKVIAATDNGSIKGEYSIDVKKNYEQLKSDYADFKGAAANPCVSWFNKIAYINYHNGFILNVGDYLGINPPGHGDFVCGMYSKRIFLWLMDKRYNADKATAAKMNGLAPMVYKTIDIPIFHDGLHLMAGISASGSNGSNGANVRFFDPWWKQMGPEIITASEEASRLRSCLLRITVPGAALAYYSGPTGWYFFITRFGTAAIAALLAQIDSQLTTKWDLDGPIDEIGDIVGQIAQTGKYNLNAFTKIQSNLDAYISLKLPKCGTETEQIFDDYTVFGDESGGTAFEPGMVENLYCPVKITLQNDSGQTFTADLLNNSFEGDFPFTGFLYPANDGTSVLNMAFYENSFEMDIEGMQDGRFTLESMNSVSRQKSVYNDVPVERGKTFELDVKGNNLDLPLMGDEGEIIYPDDASFTLTVTKSGNGTVTSSPAGINCGSDCTEDYTTMGVQVTLTATSDANWTFSGWGGDCSGTGDCQLTMDADKNVSAAFTQSGFTDDFNDGLALNWVDDGSGLWTVSNGAYVINGNKGNAVRHTYYNKGFCDFIYQADVKKIAGDGGGYVNGYGLTIRGDGTTKNLYEFVILRDGRYSIVKHMDGKYTKMVDWTSSTALKEGYNEWNTLKVAAKGSTLSFYANNTLLTNLTDTTFSCGKVGLFALDMPDADPADTVAFDNVELIPSSSEECLTFDSDLGLSIPCAAYGDAAFELDFDFFSNPDDPFGFYWKLNTLNSIEGYAGNCVDIGSDLSLPIPCVEFMGTQYEFSLNYVTESFTPSGWYWKMDLSTLKQK